MPEPARIAIDLGAESCRVSLLRWHRQGDSPSIEVIHRYSRTVQFITVTRMLAASS